jgi:mono/diheme cytochrome c family protein
MKWSVATALLTLLGTYVPYAKAQHQSVPTRADEPQKPVAEQSSMMRAGQAIYVDNCSACHTESGAGLAGLFPRLKANPLVQATDPSDLVRLVLEGGKRAATGHAPTETAMPAFGWKLSDTEIAAVLTYVRGSWGNAAHAVSAKEVSGIRQKDCTKLEARLHLQRHSDYSCKQ